MKFTYTKPIIFFYIKTPFTQSQKQESGEWLEINSQASLIHVGSNDSFALTENGISAASYLLDFVENNNVDSGKKALAIYKEIIPRENYGGEYSALQWFGEYLLAPETQRAKMISDPYVASFFEFFAADNYANLKEYLERKYHLQKLADQDTQAGQNRKAYLEDFILFNNPKREEWEKTSKFIEFLNIKPGQRIADIGSGPGYYTFRFTDLVGDQGYVFAIDTVQEHINYVNQTAEKYGVKNLKTVKTEGDIIGVDPEQVDLAFMCSLYHNIYGMTVDQDRTRFVESIKKALKKDGKLVVVDNALVTGNDLPYHGPYIAKELIIGQLKYFGFRLVDQYAVIPQRYVLVFQKV